MERDEIVGSAIAAKPYEVRSAPAITANSTNLHISKLQHSTLVTENTGSSIEQATERKIVFFFFFFFFFRFPHRL
ncbi:hypothetical protein BH10BDE1_BH10BDE1_30380 [soil metagenome]